MKIDKFIYDLETYPNFFLASFKKVNSNTYYEFEISDRKNELDELRLFLSQPLKLIGFNNLNFDYPVLHNTVLRNGIKTWTSEEIYEEVKRIIEAEYSSIRDRFVKIPQLDLYKIWHYDNKNKATSLKWLEFSMRLPNVEDLPYTPGSILNDKQKDKTILYCRNDLDATEQFFLQSLKHISIRQFYSNLEGINLINASEIRMSKEIFGKYLARDMGISTYDLNKMRTFRKTVDLSNDVIFDYIKFEDETNIKTLEKFKSYSWFDTTGMSKERAKQLAIKFSVPYKNVIREYAEGGLHSFGKPGIYESDDDNILVDVDFSKAESRNL